MLGLVLPVLLFTSTRNRQQATRRLHWSSDLKIRLYYGNGLLLCCLALIVLVGWWLSNRAFTDLGLGWGEMPYDPIATGILFFFLLAYGIDLYDELGSSERRQHTRQRFRELGFLPASCGEYLHFLFLAVCAGVCEEIIYRGFMVNYLHELLGNDPIAIVAVLVVPAISFGLGHFYQGGRAVLKIVVMAVLFGYFFFRTGTLWPLMLLHTAVDAVGGLLSWYLESRE